MQLLERLDKQDLLAILLHGILLLFFLQLISDFVEAIYVFGLLGQGLPVELVTVLLLFSPLVLLLLPRGLSGWPLILVGELMLACRVVEPLLDTRGRMFVAGLGVACFLVLLPPFLAKRKSEPQVQDRPQERGLLLGTSLTLALSLSILFRALGSGSDLSTIGMFQLFGWFLALVAGILLVVVLRSQPAPSPRQATQRDSDAASVPASFWRTAGFSLGLMAVLVLCYFAFSAPNVIARWTGVDYRLLATVLVAAFSLFAYLLTTRPRLLTTLTPGLILAWNLLFALALVLTIVAHQVHFPTDPGAYPLPAPPVTLLHHIPLFLTLVLVPIVPIDFLLFAGELAASKPSPRRLGGAFALASLYLLLMIFAHIFTSTYDYIPVVGPFFRDKFWLVHLVAGLAVVLPVLLVRRPAFQALQARREGQPAPALASLVILASVATIASALLITARPADPPAGATTLKVFTYNILQGNSEDGQKNFDGQLAVIRKADPDVVGLVECDTNRIAGGNADVVRYFADRLDMYAYYGPKTVVGTFGVALLSRYPIENPRTVYHYSQREQEATIEAQITVGGRTFNLYVTHLASEDDDENLAQMGEILQMVLGKENVVAIGDFNFRPDTKQYRLTTKALDDSWLLRWPGGTETQGIDPARRIDHIFVSPGTDVSGSEYLPSPQSDHPAMVTTIEW